MIDCSNKYLSLKGTAEVFWCNVNAYLTDLYFRWNNPLEVHHAYGFKIRT